MQGSDKLKEIKERLQASTPAPWGPYAANIPFYAEVIKPSPSLSKHDDKRPTYWRIEDALFVAHAGEDVEYLLNRVEVAEMLMRLFSSMIESGGSRDVVHAMLEEYKGAFPDSVQD